MRCSVCGADNIDGSVYCEDCGARLPGSPAMTSSGAAAAVTQEAHVPPAPVAPPPAAVAPPPPPPPLPTPEPTPAPVVAPAASAITCGACGAVNPPGVAFCEDCGASLSEAPPRPLEITPPVSYDAPAPTVVTPPPVAVVAPVAVSRLIHTSGKEFPLNKDTILMGRRSPVDGIFPEVDLTDLDTESYISRKHGRITRNDQGYFFEDLGSSNGSFHNGTRLQAHVQQALKEGDSLRLGKSELMVRLH